MARLTYKARKKLPAKDFALGKGRYPMCALNLVLIAFRADIFF